MSDATSKEATGRWGVTRRARRLGFWSRFQWRRRWFGDGLPRSRQRQYVL